MVSFQATPEPRPRGGIRIGLPFDPAAEWGSRATYHLTGRVGGSRIRGAVSRTDPTLALGPVWVRDAHLTSGESVEVVLELEGPQFATLEDDLRAAIGPGTEAARFFDELPTHYRLNFTRWVGEAKRPDTRARRVTQTAAALKEGRRER